MPTFRLGWPDFVRHACQLTAAHCRRGRRTLLTLCFLPVLFLLPVTAADTGYTGLIAKANQLFKDGKLDEARQIAMTASALAPNRFEAYFLAGAVARQQDFDAEARRLVEKALALAPPGRKEKIRAYLADMGEAKPVVAEVATLSPAEQRVRDELLLIMASADRAGMPDDRRKNLREFLEKSTAFLKAHPEQEQLWALRAVAALELNDDKSGRRAGRRLIELGYGQGVDDKAGKLMATLSRKGWLKPQSAAVAKTGDWPGRDRSFENSLGMKFVPLPGTEVLFSVWDTRVQDYREFAASKTTNVEWPKVDFQQGPTHPAVNVSWNDAKAFCAWLTEKEQRAGRLGPDQDYRLPTDAEWSAAVGLPAEPGYLPKEKDGKIQGIYPWGRQWPPPPGAANYADQTAQKNHADWATIADYDDGYAETSPVGSFPPNRFGLYDMGGNVWQWCEDWYDAEHKTRVLRGASFSNGGAGSLRSSYRFFNVPGFRSDNRGFRCVLEVSSSAP